MTLTTVVGTSGSGKTTFLNDVHKQHKCTYLRQYHNIRPYTMVSKIPNFDPTQLPFWDIYERENTCSSIRVGGTMAGTFTAGLSGGQRKLLLFELMYQRTLQQSQLLLVLDEPFAGVTDDFVPYIVERLSQMRKTHNILLVTNDHIATLTEIADNTIRVSAIDRTKVTINNKDVVDRETAILALSVGDEFEFAALSQQDLQFFWDVEIVGNGGILLTLAFVVISFVLFLITFWDSAETSAALVLIAGSNISFFVISPYLLSLCDWRNYMSEEAEALVHSSKGMNKCLKTILTLGLMFVISLLQYGVTQFIIQGDGLSGWDFWLAIFFDNASLQFPFICFGIYTQLPHQLVEMLSGAPFLFMIFFSTTYSPGSGMAVIKELRYLFARFYLFCMTPYVGMAMEGCPASDSSTLALLIITGCLSAFVFILFMASVHFSKKAQRKLFTKKIEALQDNADFKRLQLELYGVNQLRKLQHRSESFHTLDLTSSTMSFMNDSEHGSVVTSRSGSTGSDGSPTLSRSKSTGSLLPVYEI